MILTPFLLTLSVITYRWIAQERTAPPPIALGGATVIFGGVSLLEKADKDFATACAWGFFIGAVVAGFANPNTSLIGTAAGIPADILNQAAEAATLNKLQTPTTGNAPGTGAEKGYNPLTGPLQY